MKTRVKYKIYLIVIGILLILCIGVGQLVKSLRKEKEEPGERGPLANAEVFVLGTSKTIDGLEEGQVYTDLGVLSYDASSLSLEDYRMKNIQVVLEDQRITAFCGTLEKETTLQNVWITGISDKGFTIFADGFYIAFDGEKPSQDVNGVLADVVIAYEKVSEIRLKQDRIQGTILSVRADGVEIDGYGVVPFSENFRVFQTYGELAQKTLTNLVVGYDVTEFVVAKGEVCAGLISKPLSMDHIRVLLKTNDYADIFHSQVQLTGDAGYSIYFGDASEEHGAGESVTISADSPYWTTDRIRIEPAQGGGLTLQSVNRSQGNPVYRGSLEILKRDGGLVVVNDISLEEYLYGVLPSEMPSSYGAEALKAQAVCARSYAYNQILNSGYPEYGAHADDSVKFQVYNNLAKTEEVVKAVDETSGVVAACQGNVINAYYFSTSCGHTTDATIWGAEQAGDTPYLVGKFTGPDQPGQDLSTEEAFAQFIGNTDYVSYDSEEPWYRWKTTIPVGNIQEALKAFGDVGQITELTVSKRTTGGAAAELTVKGSGGELTVSTEYDIRSVLTPKGCKITRQDGSEVDGSALLPSGYILFTPVMDQGKLTAVEVTGGGYGHGAGMSQNGAKHMAAEGKTYQDILQFYYTGIQFQELY